MINCKLWYGTDILTSMDASCTLNVISQLSVLCHEQISKLISLCFPFTKQLGYFLFKF